MVSSKFKKLETVFQEMYALIMQIEDGKFVKPLTPNKVESIKLDFAVLKGRASRLIKSYLVLNPFTVEKRILEEIAAGLKRLESVNTQYAPAIMTALIKKLREF